MYCDQKEAEFSHMTEDFIVAVENLLKSDWNSEFMTLFWQWNVMNAGTLVTSTDNEL